MGGEPYPEPCLCPYAVGIGSSPPWTQRAKVLKKENLKKCVSHGAEASGELAVTVTFVTCVLQRYTELVKKQGWAWFYSHSRASSLETLPPDSVYPNAFMTNSHISLSWCLGFL